MTSEAPTKNHENAEEGPTHNYSSSSDDEESPNKEDKEYTVMRDTTETTINTNKEWPNVFQESHDMLVISSAMFFLSKLRLLSQQGKLLPEHAAAIMECPITIGQIVAAMETNGEAIKDIEGVTEFGDQQGFCRVDLHYTMLKSSMRATLAHAPSAAWKIVEYCDQRSDQELVYAVMVDDLHKRVVIPFRGSVTRKDWLTNLHATLAWHPNPLRDKLPQQPKSCVMHRGFRNYVFDSQEKYVKDKDDKDEIDPNCTKFDCILESAAKALQERPGYDLYTTGISLGGALTTVFALYAAASDDPRIPKPVTCYNFGSPKVGTLSFRKAFQALEESGKLRCLRVVNENDPVKELPQRMVCGRSMCCSHLAVFCQPFYYRHVGMTLFQHQQEGVHSFHYPRLTNSYCQLLWDDWMHHEVLLRACCGSFLRGDNQASTSSSLPKRIRKYHGYPEYLHRLEANREGLLRHDLNQLYEEAAELEVPCLCCPLCWDPPAQRGDGEMSVHYW